MYKKRLKIPIFFINNFLLTTVKEICKFTGTEIIEWHSAELIGYQTKLLYAPNYCTLLIYGH